MHIPSPEIDANKIHRTITMRKEEGTLSRERAKLGNYAKGLYETLGDKPTR